MNLAALRQVAADFRNEVERAESGQESSLYWLRLDLTAATTLPSVSKIFALSIGGSNAQFAWLEKVGNNTEVAFTVSSEVITKDLPVFTTGDQLLDFMAALIPSEAEYVGINFAYGTEQQDLDGLPDASLVAAKNKEHNFEGLVGKSLVQALRGRLGNKQVKIGVVNDSVCLSMAGRAAGIAAGDSPVVCGVLGTGLNFSISPNQGVYVNLEAGKFDKLKMPPSLSYVDSLSNENLDMLLEKATAGKYLYQHYNYLAVADSSITRNESITSTLQLSNLAEAGDKLAQEVMADSASLIAAVICGLADCLGQNQLVIPMEGSLFWQGHNYQQLVKDAISAISEDKLSVGFAQIPYSNLLGLAEIYA
jgi:hexokinase